jgi:YVTN family beta-propeller protein
VPSAISVIDRATHTVTRTLIGGVGAGFVTLTPDGKKAYVSNEDGLNISVLDTVTGTQIATVPMPVSGGESVSPYSSVLSPDGGRLYTLVAYPGFPTFLVAIDTATNAVVFDDQVDATASLPLTISADGGTLYMCGGRIEIFDVATQQVTGTAPIPSSANGPHGFAVSPDRAYAIVTASEYTGNFGQFALVDLNTKTIVKQIGFPQYEVTGPAVFSPDGSLAYFTSYQKASHQARVQVFDMASRTIAKTFPASGADAIAVTPDGSEIEVGNSGNATVVAMNAATGAVIRTIATPGTMVSITVSPDGRWIYVPDYESSMVQVIEPETSQIVGQIPAGHLGTYGTAILKTSLDGSRTVLTGETAVTIIDNLRQQIVGVVPMPNPFGIALTPSGNLAYTLSSAYPQEWLVVVDTRAAKAVGVMQFPAGVSAGGPALSPDGKTLYLPGKSCPAQGSCAESVLLVDAAALQITGQIPLANCSETGAIVTTRDGSIAYVGCGLSNGQIALSIVDLTQGRVVGSIPLFGLSGPTSLAIAPGQVLLYAVCDGWVNVIDLQQQTMIANFLTVSPSVVAVSPDGQLVYVTSSILPTSPMTVITALPGGPPQGAGTIAMPAPSTGVAFAP